MSDLIEVTPSAYGCPLLIRRLLEAGVAAAPTQQIVYADRSRQINPMHRANALGSG